MALSVTEAALEGFRVIGKKPVSVVVWSLVWIVLAYGPLVWLFASEGPRVIEAVRSVQSAGTDPKVWGPQLVQTELHLLGVMFPWFLWLWVVGTVIQAAIFRAVLEPGHRAFAYLRLGGDELRLLLLRVIYFALAIAYVCVAVGVGVALAIAARALAQPWQGLAIAVVVLSLILLTLYLSLRLILAAPMTFAEKHLRIFDSWALTRGKTLAMLGVLLLTMIFVIVAAMIFGAVRNVFMYGALGDIAGEMGRSWRTGLQPGMDMRLLSDLPRLVGPALIVILVVQGLFETAVRVVAASPFAEAYRELAENA